MAHNAATAAAELSQARAALARAERRGDTAAAAHLRGIVGNAALIARRYR